jgi:hypothetical protein
MTLSLPDGVVELTCLHLDPSFPFVSSTTGLVYVAGGINERFNYLAAAEAYNLEEDKWEILFRKLFCFH